MGIKILSETKLPFGLTVNNLRCTIRASYKISKAVDGKSYVVESSAFYNVDGSDVVCHREQIRLNLSVEQLSDNICVLIYDQLKAGRECEDE
jgi:hypothetical protein